MEKNNYLIPLENVKGIGSNFLKVFHQKSIKNTYSLVNHFPKKYDNYEITDLNFARHEEIITVVGIIDTNIIVTPLKKILKIEFELKADNSLVNIIMFRPVDFISSNFKPGDEVQAKGKYNLYHNRIDCMNIKKYNPEKEKIVPVYGIEGIFDYQISNIIKNIFDDKQVNIFETLPYDFLNKYHLLSRPDLLYNAHLPKTLYDVNQVYKRLKYEEALLIQLQIQSARKRIKRDSINYDLKLIKEFIETISYELTACQKAAVNDIFKDYKSEYLSFRLIQGDVGSGKTIVSVIALYGMITAQKQVAFMVPTEILANQHYNLLTKLLGNKINIALLTQKTKNKPEIKENLKNGKIDLVIGTQSLIQDDVSFKDLGLVIIDEQHRFGVETREILKNKGMNTDCIYLSATPIPRTLAISIFGNIEITSIYEKPKNRIEGKTFYYSDKKLKDVYEKVHEELNKGNQAFVVVPAIDSDLKDENIETVSERIKKEFDNPVFIIHGKMKKSEIEETLNSFSSTKSSILIATSMIEVGIDIKDATVMIIFSAENFGLSQLHQLRGRIGRSDKLSYCYLISKKTDVDRLSFLTTNYDGFKLSEYDLKERGPGDFIGIRQSGKLEYKYINFNSDFNILNDCLSAAKKIYFDESFETNPKYNQLRKSLKSLVTNKE